MNEFLLHKELKHKELKHKELKQGNEYKIVGNYYSNDTIISCDTHLGKLERIGYGLVMGGEREISYHFFNDKEKRVIYRLEDYYLEKCKNTFIQIK